MPREIFVCFSHSFSYFLSLYLASGLCGTTALRSPTMIYVNTLLLCSGLILCPRGRRHLLAPPGKDEKNFMYQKTMIVITIAFVSCLVWVCLRLLDANAPLLWLRSGIERDADRKLSLCCQFFVSGFVGLLTYPFMCGGFPPCTNALLQPSLGAMTALPMTGFHRTRGFPAWKTIL